MSVLLVLWRYWFSVAVSSCFCCFPPPLPDEGSLGWTCSRPLCVRHCWKLKPLSFYRWGGSHWWSPQMCLCCPHWCRFVFCLKTCSPCLTTPIFVALFLKIFCLTWYFFLKAIRSGKSPALAVVSGFYWDCNSDLSSCNTTTNQL